jgi:hypothetical protein
MQQPIQNSPLMKSIRLGSRETYLAFLEHETSFFSNLLELQCRKAGYSRNGSHWWAELAQVLIGRSQGSIPFQEHTHKVNPVQTALNIFVNASHEDSFFL